MLDDSMRTYQTRPHLDRATEEALHACAALFSHVEHSLFAEIASGKSSRDLKSSYLIKYGITARQYNACRVNIEAKIASIKERRKGLIAELKERIEALEKKMPKLRKDPRLAHQKKRRLQTLKQRLQKLTQDHEAGRVPLCFGSQKRFRAQFNLENSQYKNHAEWLADWRHARSSEIFFLGSKDETSGNQTCTASIAHGTLTLRIRLPNALVPKFGKHLKIPQVNFAYGQEEMLTSLNLKQAITYRFKHDKKGWRIFASTSLPKPACKSNPHLGVIGVDINTDHLALVETDRFGNPLEKTTFPLSLYGKTKKQALALIGDTCAKIVTHCEKTNKALILEELDFQKKKQILREKYPASLARQLSSFSYQAIITHLKSRAYRKQVEVKQVNPAFTSVIGRVKFARRYGLSIHHAAALSIGRRALNLSERVPRHLGKIPDGRDDHVALTLSVRNRDKHVWSLWRSLSKELKTALAAHFRAKRSSSTFKAAPETEPFSDLVGAIPTREPSAELLGRRPCGKTLRA